jgi:hypothetical protein
MSPKRFTSPGKAETSAGPVPNAVPSTVQPEWSSWLQSSNTTSSPDAAPGAATNCTPRACESPNACPDKVIGRVERARRHTGFSLKPSSSACTDRLVVLRSV